MALPTQITFQVRPESYAVLTIDALASLINLTPGTPTSTLQQPPLRQPVLDTGSPGQSSAAWAGQSSVNPNQVVPGTQPGGSGEFNRTWKSWLHLLYNWVTAGAIAPGSSQLTIVAPSVDESDIDWWGTTAAISDNHTDPVSAGVTLTNSSRFSCLVTITNQGSGFGSSPPAITISSVNGQGYNEVGVGILDGSISGHLIGYQKTTGGYNLKAPLKVTITPANGATATATLGRQWAVGDYVLWNDPTIVSGAYSYEIDQITQITPSSASSATFKFARHQAGSPLGNAQYGSLMNSHSGSTAAFFRLINKEFFAQIDLTAGPQVMKFLWDNMCVAAVQFSNPAINTVTQNLAPLVGANPSAIYPPCPGLRTMAGAAYTNLVASGALTVGGTAAYRVSVQAWETIRTVYARVAIPPVGATTFNGDTNAAIVVYICYVDPTEKLVGLIDTVVIDTGNYDSFVPLGVTPPPNPNPPDGRQMPYHVLWGGIQPNSDWPPNVLPKLIGALSTGKQLQLGFSISTTASVVFSPDGWIDFIVAQIGTTTAGSNLVVTVQT